MATARLQALALGAAAALVALALWFGGVLAAPERLSWDARVRLLARPAAAEPRVVLILLDQASLDWGSRENGLSWPWPRELYTPIIDFCARAGARVVAFDVLFTEPSGYGVADDATLAAALRRAGNVVLARFLSLRPGRLEASAVTEPLAELGAAARAVANVSDTPDADGVMRRAGLVRRGPDGELVPSLGVAAWAVAEQAAAEQAAGGDDGGAEGATGGAAIGGGPGGGAIGGVRPVLERAAGGHWWLRLGSRRVPVRADGTALLRYRGRGAFPTYSAAAIIQSELRLRDGEKPVVAPEALRGACVLVGFSAPGLLDLRPTPLSRVSPGVMVHATALDDLLEGDFGRDVPALVVALATLLWGVAAALLVVGGGHALRTVAVAAVAVGASPLLGGALYGAGWWWPILPPALAGALAVFGGVVRNYAVEGRQRRFIKSAFRHYLSPAVIERILDDPAALRLGGERRTLTIMFSDLEGFTSLSEGMEPEALTALLNDYLSAMTEIILEEGGTLDKYEGDAILAFWNAPLDQPDHALRAARAAVRCQVRLRELGPEFRRRCGRELRARIGLHSGPVVVGNMGSQQRFDYTVLGDAANLASRLEGANKVFGSAILASAATAAAAGLTAEGGAGGDTGSDAGRDAESGTANAAGNAADAAARPGGAIGHRPLGALRVVGRREPVEVVQLFDPAQPPPAATARGIALLRAGKLEEAITLFADPAATTDPAAVAYLARCRRALAAGEEFRGVWNLTQK